MYKEQHPSNICKETIAPCENQEDCLLGKFTLCVSKTCRCEPNYHYDQITKACILFRCETDLECQQDDYNRICKENGIRLCREGFHGGPDQMCLSNTIDNFKHDYFWPIVGTLTALLILTTICCCRRTKCRIICAKQW